ncbi:MAG TPA: lysylphosphatidylglycerol synthase transmembrane domain-containing protein [Kofleriaceae bacterium]|nr:lysylphosphatidylglycerol synthase transmembrane domain-containing protein [Kofleriaceae bacterium]
MSSSRDDVAAPPDAAAAPPSTAAAAAPKHRLWWILLLVVVGGGGIYLGAPNSDVLRVAWARLSSVRGAAIAIVVGGALGLVATEALRIAVIGRLVGVRVSARDAWDAAVANHVMTAVTPQVGLGEPTVAYTLGRRGTPWDAAVAIPFIKFTSSLVLVFVLGAALVGAGFGPVVDGRIGALGIVWFLAIAAITSLVIAICSSPSTARRWIGRIAGWLSRRRWFASPAWQARIENSAQVTIRTADRLAGVRRASWRSAIALVAVHLIYYASYVAPLVCLACVLGDPPVITLALRSLVYLCFLFAMPTPGGTGPGEAAAAVFFGDLVPPADAIVIVAVFRAATFYLQLAIGALYLPIRSLALSRR